MGNWFDYPPLIESLVNMELLSYPVGKWRILTLFLLLGVGAATPIQTWAWQTPGSGPVKEKDPKQVQIEALQSQAEQLFANKAWDNANSLSQQILAINDKSVVANVIRGRVLLGKGDFTGAVTEFDAGLELPGRDEY